MLTPSVRPEGEIQPSSVMVRSETDPDQPNQNHPTQDHDSLSHPEQAGEQAAGRPKEVMMIGDLIPPSPPISPSETLAAQHHLALVQPVAEVLHIENELHTAFIRLRDASPEETATAQLDVNLILTRLARAASAAVLVSPGDGERGHERRPDSIARSSVDELFLYAHGNSSAHGFPHTDGDFS